MFETKTTETPVADAQEKFLESVRELLASPCCRCRCHTDTTCQLCAAKKSYHEFWDALNKSANSK